MGDQPPPPQPNEKSEIKTKQKQHLMGQGSSTSTSHDGDGGGIHTSVRARYLGPISVNGPGGDLGVIMGAVQRLRSSPQITKVAMAISNKEIKITDRSGNDVLLVASRDALCSHGTVPETVNFVYIVVNQSDRFYCHVLNMPKADAHLATQGMIACFGGGNSEVLSHWMKKNKKLARKSMKGSRRSSSVSLPPSNENLSSSSLHSPPSRALRKIY